MKDIQLKKIDEFNFLDAFRLELNPEQEQFVSHPIRSLAQAYVYYHQCVPFGIYCEAEMVGYVMVIYDVDEACYNIWHMMIDRRYQGRGCGRAALLAVLEFIRGRPFGDSRRVLLTCNPENAAALQLYASAGFTRTGRDDADEIELELNL